MCGKCLLIQELRALQKHYFCKTALLKEREEKDNPLTNTNILYALKEEQSNSTKTKWLAPHLSA